MSTRLWPVSTKLWGIDDLLCWHLSDPHGQLAAVTFSALWMSSLLASPTKYGFLMLKKNTSYIINNDLSIHEVTAI